MIFVANLSSHDDAILYFSKFANEVFQRDLGPRVIRKCVVTRSTWHAIVLSFICQWSHVISNEVSRSKIQWTRGSRERENQRTTETRESWTKNKAILEWPALQSESHKSPREPENHENQRKSKPKNHRATRTRHLEHHKNAKTREQQEPENRGTTKNRKPENHENPKNHNNKRTTRTREPQGPQSQRTKKYYKNQRKRRITKPKNQRTTRF